MIGQYGKLPAAKIQSFTAQAIHRPENKYQDEHVSVHTDGVTLTTEAHHLSQFRLLPNKLYRVTVEEID